jgi:hypothetical protein
MTTSITIIPGMRIGNWEVLSADPTGKRACASCVCGAVRILSVAAHGTASPSCGCRQLSREQSDALRREVELQEQRRDQKLWREFNKPSCVEAAPAADIQVRP